MAAVGRFRYLSAFQLDRLLYGSAESHVQASVSALVKKELLGYVRMPNYLVGGRPRQIYHLARKGVSYLRSFELPCKVSRETPSYQTLKHSLAINDVLIGAHKVPGYSLIRFQTEFELKSRPINGLAPDGVLALERQGSVFPIVVEVDRDTEQRTFFKDKIRRLVSYSQRDYRTHLGYDSLTIAVVESTASSKRLAELVRWTEQELSSLGAQSLASIFFFASFPTDQRNLGHLFCSSIWRTPFSGDSTALIESPP